MNDRDDTEPLTQFHEWFDRAKMPGGALDDTSPYTLARAAFYAGFAARPQEPIEPSRNALDGQKDVLEKYRVATYRPLPVIDAPYSNTELRVAQYLASAPYPDYVQHGTITGYRRDKSRRFAEVYGFEPETAQPAERGLLGRTRDALVDDTRDFPAVTRADTTVWQGYGAPGPVPTALSTEEDHRG